MVTDGITSVLDNEGFIQTYQDGNPGNFELQNEGTVMSIGDFMIANDWVNNGALQIQTGDVEMYGDNQWFLGDSVSSFWNLALTGSDRKEQGQDIRVRSVLDITARELAVHAEDLYIDSANPNIILYDNTFLAEGIISTDEDGRIKKNLSQNELNLIPTGSSQGSFRHRPIKILLSGGTITDTAYITFHHHSSDLVSAFEADIDTSLCRIQDAYFYTINSADPNNFYQLDFAHYPPNDGLFPDVAQWNNPTWKVIYDDGDYSDANYEYSTAFNETNFVDEHYTLAYRKPMAPYILIDTTECYNTAIYQVEMPLGQPWYQWSIYNNDSTAYIVDGQGTDIINVDWAENIGGWVYTQYEDAEGCWSHMDSSMVNDVSIEADFTYTHDYSSGLDTEFTFTSELTSNVDEIEWFIENDSEWLIDPEMSLPYNYIFSTNGESVSYDVTLYAYDHDHGCLDTATRTIVVPNIFVFYAPNSFTPNGDADNNTFFGYANDISHAKLEIYNRWGQQIFFDEGVDLSKMVWDGTFNGQIVQDGTYSYKFTIWPVNYNNGELSAFEYPGHVIVLR